MNYGVNKMVKKKLKRPKDDYLYYDKGYIRRKQIYDWVISVLGFHKDLQDLITLASIKEKREDAYNKFKKWIENLMAGQYKHENGETLGYLIEINKDEFGYNTIIRDLFDNVVLKRTKRVTKRQQERIDLKELETDVEEIERREPRRKYYEIDGKTGRLEIDVDKRTNKIVARLRDIETGRYLKTPQEIKDRFKENS